MRPAALRTLHPLARDLPECTPALSDLVARLLGRQLRAPGEPHDAVADARAAMDLALFEQQKGPTPALEAPQLQVGTATALQADSVHHHLLLVAL